MNRDPFQFGIVGDVQFVDDDDGPNFDGSAIRRYRQSYDIFSQASKEFDKLSIKHSIQVGDVIDLKCKNYGTSEVSFNQILDCAKSSKQEWKFCLGNHDFVCLSREKLYDLAIDVEFKSFCSPSKLFYDYSPSPGIRFLILDAYDISLISPSTVSNGETAARLIHSKNPNVNIPGRDWLIGLPRHLHKFVPFNGGIGRSQLDWLRRTLQFSQDSKELCFIFSHVPIFEGCCDPATLMFNNDEVLSVIHDFENIAAFIAGHDHNGGYGIDVKGIHHIIPPAPLECMPSQVAYGYISVHDSYFQLHWYGKLPKWGNVDMWQRRMQINYNP